jgi:hypothetical protein
VGQYNQEELKGADSLSDSERDLFAKHSLRRGLLRSFAVVLAFLRVVNAVEVDTLCVIVMRDFDGGGVEKGNPWPGEVSGRDRGNRSDSDQKASAASARLAASITALLVFPVLCGTSFPVTPAARLGVIPPL